MEALKNIYLRTEPDPVLREKSAPVAAVGERERALFLKMSEIMRAHDGLGLAAPQVGVPARMIAIDAGAIEEREHAGTGAEGKFLFFANPMVVDASAEDCIYEEGCLSVPTIYADVERPEWVEVEYFDFHGERRRLRADGLLARCLLHEMDHLDGKLFIDYLSAFRRNMIMSKLAKLKALK